MRFVHLHCHSWYSFLAGASSPGDLAERAAAIGQNALAITDDWTLAGAVQHAQACIKHGIKPIFGARVVADGLGLILLCSDSSGYACLCDILTYAHRKRLNPQLTIDDLANAHGLFCFAHVEPLLDHEERKKTVARITHLKIIFNDFLFIELFHHRRSGDYQAVLKSIEFANEMGLQLVATNAVRHATHHDYKLYDALLCAKHRITVAQGHSERPQNEAAFLCNEHYFGGTGIPSEALKKTQWVADRCNVDLLSPEVEPPHAAIPSGITAEEYLRQVCIEGFRARYPNGNTEAVKLLKKELEIIGTLELEEFFLVVREVVQFARSRHIRCSGRGSAANSLVAYLTGITEVCPIKHKLLFERFLHEGRRGMPDIDVDFDSSRRDEVIAWMIERWGDQHTAMTANVITFRLRSAVREIATALGFPIAAVNRTGRLLPHANVRHVRNYRRELAIGLCGGRETPAIETLCTLVEQMGECPRHLSLHSGGMILSRKPLNRLSPVQTSANSVRQIQFAKDDVEKLGLIKFDVLGLRMLAVISEAVLLINGRLVTAHEDISRVDIISLNDPKAFELIRSGETLALFQIESPGQWNLLARTQPQTFDDLVVQVALFRPGPLQSGMVHPFVARRRGIAKTLYPHPSLEPVLRDTNGIILFQEQVLEVAHIFADMNLSEADEFRRLMSKFRSPTEMEAMREKFVQGAMKKHRVGRALADRVFNIVAAFVGYGFCRSHAAAFARTVYQSAYLKAHYPAPYMAAVLQHKPGFFPVHTLLEEARRLGVRVLPACIVRSGVKYSVEIVDGEQAIRIPLTQIQQISLETAQCIVLERMTDPYKSIEQAVWRLNLDIGEWENLARAGALDAFGSRRVVLMEVRRALRCKPAKGQYSLAFEGVPDLPRIFDLEPNELTEWDFETQSLTTGLHPMARMRSHLDSLGASTIEDLRQLPSGTVVRVGGNVISRQRPPTARGMCFIILEDETSRLPTAIIPEVYEKHHEILRAGALLMEGKLEDGGLLAGNNYRSVLVSRIWSLDKVAGGAAGHSGENPRAGVSR